jgi:deazaflavin-dependent oxidoreductase (nitroreductase family)
MTLEGEYVPSPAPYVVEQVRLYEATGGKEGWALEGKPCVILTTKGRKSGKLRKTPLMRVKRGATYVVVASMGGAPDHPVWYLNLVDEPTVMLQDGPEVRDYTARTATDAEKTDWWPDAVEVWPPYEDYQKKTERNIPVVILDPIE